MLISVSGNSLRILWNNTVVLEEILPRAVQNLCDCILSYDFKMIEWWMWWGLAVNFYDTLKKVKIC